MYSTHTFSQSPSLNPLHTFSYQLSFCLLEVLSCALSVCELSRAAPFLLDTLPISFHFAALQVLHGVPQWNIMDARHRQPGGAQARTLQKRATSERASMEKYDIQSTEVCSSSSSSATRDRQIASSKAAMPPRAATYMPSSTLTPARIERVAWAVANADAGVSASDQYEAISRLEAMETARRVAEAKAEADEEEWRMEELRLAKEEELRRAAREEWQWEEEDEKEEAWDAERRIKKLVLAADRSADAAVAAAAAANVRADGASRIGGTSAGLFFAADDCAPNASADVGADGAGAVSYTHLTLPTKA